jgi:RNAse (barnase) inhibitor barstar
LGWLRFTVQQKLAQGLPPFRNYGHKTDALWNVICLLVPLYLYIEYLDVSCLSYPFYLAYTLEKIINVSVATIICDCWKTGCKMYGTKFVLYVNGYYI